MIRTLQTGDDSNISLWIVVMLAAGAALTGTVLYGRKKSFGK
ncbi:MAG: LPXTG cell wall anchor domain-containing protein [Lachnospiraceae bacterium]